MVLLGTVLATIDLNMDSTNQNMDPNIEWYKRKYMKIPVIYNSIVWHLTKLQSPIMCKIDQIAEMQSNTFVATCKCTYISLLCIFPMFLA